MNAQKIENLSDINDNDFIITEDFSDSISLKIHINNNKVDMIEYLNKADSFQILRINFNQSVYKNITILNKYETTFIDGKCKYCGSWFRSKKTKFVGIKNLETGEITKIDTRQENEDFILTLNYKNDKYILVKKFNIKFFINYNDYYKEMDYIIVKDYIKDDYSYLTFWNKNRTLTNLTNGNYGSYILNFTKNILPEKSINHEFDKGVLTWLNKTYEYQNQRYRLYNYSLKNYKKKYLIDKNYLINNLHNYKENTSQPFKVISNKLDSIHTLNYSFFNSTLKKIELKDSGNLLMKIVFDKNMINRIYFYDNDYYSNFKDGLYSYKLVSTHPKDSLLFNFRVFDDDGGTFYSNLNKKKLLIMNMVNQHNYVIKGLIIQFDIQCYYNSKLKEGINGDVYKIVIRNNTDYEILNFNQGVFTGNEVLNTRTVKTTEFQRINNSTTINNATVFKKGKLLYKGEIKNIHD